jgi:hypothetical protein
MITMIPGWIHWLAASRATLRNYDFLANYLAKQCAFRMFLITMRTLHSVSPSQLLSANQSEKPLLFKYGEHINHIYWNRFYKISPIYSKITAEIIQLCSIWRMQILQVVGFYAKRNLCTHMRACPEKGSPGF